MRRPVEHTRYFAQQDVPQSQSGQTQTPPEQQPQWSPQQAQHEAFAAVPAIDSAGAPNQVAVMRISTANRTDR